ncbi:hypothetical protein FIC87_11270 [Eggerthella lenta]|uniref:Type I restriction modification DNA specificity domain-containing protein n=1 Tax=Eggerthella lenta TaxID=84112 RepID=A0A5C5BUQ0_EGGLN|nr:restriction endonuclease subunit S [Eggerthella lenta]TNU89466.1 hypothetical protein FIC87_11270 [Eggerthella lenta]
MEPILRFKADDGSDFSDWEKMTLGDVCVFVRNGYAYSSDGSRNHRYKLTRIESISGGVINDEKLGSSDEIDPRYRLVDGDILFSNINSLPYLGNVARYTNDLGEIYHGMNLLCIRPRANEINSIFLFELLGTSRIRRYEITHAKAAVNQCSLPSSDVKAMSLYCPSLPEQRKIADLLSAVDDVIAAQEAEVAAWEKRKKGVMQKLFSQEVRFKADDGSDFPDWEEKTLGELGCFCSGVGFSERYQGHANLPVDVYKVSDMNISGNEREMLRANNTVDESILKKMKTKAIDQPSIIFAKVGAAIFAERKRIARKPFIVDNNMMVFTPNDENDFEYIYWLTLTLRFASRAQIGALPSYNASDISGFVVNIPSLPEQRKIADCLSALDDVTIKAKNELAKWQELKKGLLQQMFV